jgi:hypothetical protein
LSGSWLEPKGKEKKSLPETTDEAFDFDRFWKDVLTREMIPQSVRCHNQE